MKVKRNKKTLGDDTTGGGTYEDYLSTELDGYLISYSLKVLSLVKDIQLHPPYFNFIGCDMLVNSKSNPVLID